MLLLALALCSPTPRSPICVLPAFWTHYEHQKGLANLPMVTRTAQGIPGDPINVGLIGDDKDVLCAMQRRRLVSRRSRDAALVDRDRRQRAAGPRPIATRRSARCSISTAARISRSKSRSATAPITAIMCGSGRCWTGRGTAAGLARRRHLRPRRRRQPLSPAPSPTISTPISTPSASCSPPISRPPAWSSAKYQVTGVGPTRDRAQRRRRSLLHRRRGVDPAAGRGLPEADRPGRTSFRARRRPRSRIRSGRRCHALRIEASRNLVMARSHRVQMIACFACTRISSRSSLNFRHSPASLPAWSPNKEQEQ